MFLRKGVAWSAPVGHEAVFRLDIALPVLPVRHVVPQDELGTVFGKLHMEQHSQLSKIHTCNTGLPFCPMPNSRFSLKACS